MSLQFRAGFGNGLVELRDALVQAADLIDDHPQFDHQELIEGQRQHLGQPLLARQRFFGQVQPPRREKVVDLVLERASLLDQRIARLRQTGNASLLFILHPHLRQQILRQIQCQQPRVVGIGLLHRPADHPKLVAVDDHYSRHVRRHRVVEQPRVARDFHRHLVGGP